MRGEYGWGARRGRGLGEGRGWQGRYGADAAYDDSGWQQDSGQGQERGYGHGNGWRHDANAYCDCQQQGKQVNPVVVTAIHPLSVASAAGCGYVQGHGWGAVHAATSEHGEYHGRGSGWRQRHASSTGQQHRYSQCGANAVSSAAATVTCNCDRPETQGPEVGLTSDCAFGMSARDGQLRGYGRGHGRGCGQGHGRGLGRGLGRGRGYGRGAQGAKPCSVDATTTASTAAPTVVSTPQIRALRPYDAAQGLQFVPRGGNTASHAPTALTPPAIGVAVQTEQRTAAPASGDVASKPKVVTLGHSVAEIVAAGLCTGCGKCLDSCKRRQAITLIEVNDREQPVVDMQRCNLCGKCLRLCPEFSAWQALQQQ